MEVGLGQGGRGYEPDSMYLLRFDDIKYGFIVDRYDHHLPRR